MVSDNVGFSLKLPLGPEYIRLTPTLKKRAFAEVDDLLYESRYDSDGKNAPWKVSSGMYNKEEKANET